MNISFFRYLVFCIDELFVSFCVINSVQFHDKLPLPALLTSCLRVGSDTIWPPPNLHVGEGRHSEHGLVVSMSWVSHFELVGNSM